MEAQKFEMGRFNLRSKMRWKVKNSYQLKIPNKFPALETLHDDMDIKRDWETIRGSTKISAKESLGYYEYKQLKSWLDEGLQSYQIKGKRSNCMITGSEPNKWR
jgi:hypothetical protein